MSPEGNREALDRDDAGRWLCAGLCLTRVCPPSVGEVRRVSSWILAAMGERLDLPPVGVIADIGALLLGDSLSGGSANGSASVSASASAVEGAPSTRRPRLLAGDDRLDTAVRRYEDAVLGRLGADPRLQAASDAVAKLPADLRAQGVGILAAAVLAHASFARGVNVPPGLVRARTERSAREALETGFATLRDDAGVRRRLAEAYEALVHGAARAQRLIGDAEVFALENLTVLRSLTQRLGIAQVIEAREALSRCFPRRIKSTRASSGAAPTALEDESAYPVGGFSSVSTSGSLENLVTSELIYMERAGEGAPIDLFDMRYVEGELLYYTRDEAIFVRQRRLVSFVLLPDVVATRVKDPATPWQRVVLVLGLVTAVIQRLAFDLGTEALSFRVVLAREASAQPSPMRAERELFDLLLREWKDKGMAEVVEATLVDEARMLAEATRRALVECVLLSTDERRARAAWAAASSVIEGEAAAKGPAPARGLARVVTTTYATGLGAFADFETWSEAATDLLAALL